MAIGYRAILPAEQRDKSEVERRREGTHRRKDDGATDSVRLSFRHRADWLGTAGLAYRHRDSTSRARLQWPGFLTVGYLGAHLDNTLTN